MNWHSAVSNINMVSIGIATQSIFINTSSWKEDTEDLATLPFLSSCIPSLLPVPTVKSDYQLRNLLLCSSSHNDIPPAPQQNVSMATVLDAMGLSISYLWCH